VKSSEPPTATERVVATNVSAETSVGPVHGAAMMPPTRPMANAPPKPLPPTDDSRVAKEGGRLSSKAPNMDAAMATNTTAMGTITHGLAMKVPKALPASAKPTPSDAYMTPMPAT